MIRKILPGTIWLALAMFMMLPSLVDAKEQATSEAAKMLIEGADLNQARVIFESAAERYKYRVENDPKTKDRYMPEMTALDFAYQIRGILENKKMAAAAVTNMGKKIPLMEALTIEERILLMKKYCEIYIAAEGSQE